MFTELHNFILVRIESGYHKDDIRNEFLTAGYTGDFESMYTEVVSNFKVKDTSKSPLASHISIYDSNSIKNWLPIIIRSGFKNASNFWRLFVGMFVILLLVLIITYLPALLLAWFAQSNEIIGLIVVSVWMAVVLFFVLRSLQFVMYGLLMKSEKVDRAVYGKWAKVYTTDIVVLSIVTVPLIHMFWPIFEGFRYPFPEILLMLMFVLFSMTTVLIIGFLFIALVYNVHLNRSLKIMFEIISPNFVKFSAYILLLAFLMYLVSKIDTGLFVILAFVLFPYYVSVTVALFEIMYESLMIQRQGQTTNLTVQ